MDLTPQVLELLEQVRVAVAEGKLSEAEQLMIKVQRTIKQELVFDICVRIEDLEKRIRGVEGMKEELSKLRQDQHTILYGERR